MGENRKNDSAGRRLQEAVELAELTEYPVFGLAAKPSPDARFRDLFASKDAALVKLFNNPPILRKAGFSLEHDGNSRIVLGDLRRALIPAWKIMELWRDGTLIYAVDAFVQPLWGSPRPDGSLQVNPLALAEPVYLFAGLSKLIYEQSAQTPQHVEYRIHFERLIQKKNRTTLGAGPLGPFFFGTSNQHAATESNMDRTIVWGRRDIEPGRVAYELIQEFYHSFGISDDGIPYTKKGANGELVVDPEALKKAGQPLSV
jgi:hypothetical protein